MAKKRIVYIDVIKFVAILLVCIGHCYNMTTTLDSSLRPIIYSFHMPLFMIVSGFFAISASKRTFADFLRKRSFQLLIPVITCTTLTLLISYIIGGVKYLYTAFTRKSSDAYGSSKHYSSATWFSTQLKLRK